MNSTRMNATFPQRRYLSSAGSLQTAFELTAVRKPVGVDSNGHLQVLQAGASFSDYHRVVLLDGGRGSMFNFFGTADGQTADGKLWAVTFPGESNPQGDFSSQRFCQLHLFATASITLSTAAGAGTSDLISASELLADTLSFTIADYGTFLQNAFGLGALGEYSPADNTPAAALISNFGSPVHGWLWEFDLTGAASMNVLYSITG